ncbi:DUF3726 domain-containing protein [Pseudorhodobacter sp. E13]|uniref:DUF3726 domain-containing protein n=1 Tax=Pseudorhodobacter sp. E13 TaxID=2487931 RepID=UPI000F8D482F|nr:DUF3726 domain-containing protein [Pseudorhodobacter sp. E13]RUS60783.1 DUF3726 domain-containing protein [Pseudorhodobacter sp. E13]
MTELAGDQTRGDSTAFFSGGQSARMSQNEVAALCLKAARGAGMTWGMAEEAGFAASWLTARGLDGPRLLLAHLTAAQGRAWADLCPAVAPGAWAAPKGKSLCPIALGATLSDHAALATGLGAAPIKVGPVDQPLLVLPFLGSIAGASAGTVTMAWDGGTIEVDPAGRLTPDALAPLDGKTGVTLHLSLRHGQGARAGQREPAPAIAAQTIAGLNAFALRTTVPASDASRAGAGASSSDND